MKLYLLSYSPLSNPDSSTTKSINLLVEAAARQGHVLDIIKAKDCKLLFDNKPRMLIHGLPPRGIKTLLAKASFSGKNLLTHGNLLHQFELMGIKTTNSYASILRTKDKIMMLQTLSSANIPIPKTFIVRSAEYVGQIAKSIGSYPVILKSVAGAQGIGVSIVESDRGLRSIVEMILEDGDASPVIIQQYVKESRGKDIRIFVVGGKIVAAMERIATKKGEFRSNFSLGGKVRLAELSLSEKKLALKATKACGLDFSGVDLIRTKEGPKILEVNCNPGLDGITQASGVDVAGTLIKYLVRITKQNT
jgi:ribosomal protein S6--L-glutamate ligase